MLVKVGSSVLVKRSGQLDADVAPNVADNGQLALAPDVVLKRAVVQARKGDTAALLSKRYGVSAANLAEWNPGLGSATLRKGQSVVVFLPVRAKGAAEQRAQVPAAAPRAAAGAKSVPRSSAKPAAKPASKPPARPAAKAKR
jgi:membrane-bound lytic murein transglycosylase D